MQARDIATTQKQSIYGTAPIAASGRPTAVATTRVARKPTLCSGSGVSSLSPLSSRINANQIKEVANKPTAVATPSSRLPTREVVIDLADGAWSTVKAIGKTFKNHPVVSSAIAAGIAATLFEFPIVGTALLAFGIGSSLWDIGKGLVGLRKGARDHSKAEEDEGIKEVGGGLLGLAFSSVSVLLGARPTLALTRAAAHEASGLNPGMMFHAVDDLPNLFAAAVKHHSTPHAKADASPKP